MTRALPLLGPEARALLRDWARGDAATRPWAALLRLAGPARLELADDLAGVLERTGWATPKRSFVKGTWRLDGLVWTDLPALKAALGLDSRDDRRARRADALARLDAWAGAHPDHAEAVAPLHDGVLDAARLDERLALLQALAAWQDDARSGTRRDFEWHARGATKSITEAEWRWLGSTLDLSACRIEGFLPVLWLAGDLRLQWDDGRGCDLSGLHLAGLPVDDVLRVSSVQPPQRYWLIENRASFERQAARATRAPGVAVLWLPGRPPISWQSAVATLLERAPAPAWISADPDPAGVEIALTAGALWSARGLVWTPWRMGVPELGEARHRRPLDGDHDPRVLARLQARADLPEALQALCAYMAAEQVKGEQEGWL